MNDRQMRLIKRAFMPLTDPAMAAQGGMPPQGGAAMPPPGGMPPVDPNTGAPMDPAMAGGAPMPPVDPNTGMPMDPSMMGGDPAMMAQNGMPPQGGMPPTSTGDPVIDTLLGMGAMILDPNGQPVPPEMIAQMVQEINAQGGMPPQGEVPQDPNADATMETMAQLDKNVSVLIDKVDSIRALIDDLRGAGENAGESAGDTAQTTGGDPNEIDPELMAFLEEQAAANQGPSEGMMVDASGQPIPPEVGGIDPNQAQQLSLMQAMQTGGYR